MGKLMAVLVLLLTGCAAMEPQVVYPTQIAADTRCEKGFHGVLQAACADECSKRGYGQGYDTMFDFAKRECSCQCRLAPSREDRPTRY